MTYEMTRFVIDAQKAVVHKAQPDQKVGPRTRLQVSDLCSWLGVWRQMFWGAWWHTLGRGGSLAASLGAAEGQAQEPACLRALPPNQSHGADKQWCWSMWQQLLNVGPLLNLAGGGR